MKGMNRNRMGLGVGLAAALSLLLCQSPRAQAAVTLLDKDDWKVSMGGFVELDMISDSTRSLKETVANSAIARPGTWDGDNGRTQFSMRNSRLAFTILPPAIGEWKTKGYFEMDFLGTDNGTSESGSLTAPTLRLRHAYWSAEANGWQILAGQYWTLFGWQMAYTLPTASLPPVPGVLYARVPQVTLLKNLSMSEVSKLQAAFSIERPAQRDSQLPDLVGGLRLSTDVRKAAYNSSPSGDVSAQPMSLALTGTLREFVAPNPGATSTTDTIHQTGSGFAVDTMIPVIASSDGTDVGNTLSLAAEFSMGRGYADYLPSWTAGITNPIAAASGLNLDAGQGAYDTSGSFNLIDLTTVTVNLQYHLPTDCHSYINIGFGQLYSDNVSSFAGTSLLTSTKAYNRTQDIFANFFHDFTKNIRLALEYDHFLTGYVDGTNAIDNRFQVSTWFRL